MQTFLPYDNFEESASVLDWKRLGKQRVEAMQIVNAIEKQTGWRHHPVVHMWTPYIPALKHYTNVMIEEWIKRGYNNTMNLYDVTEYEYDPPNWLGNKTFHSSHRANLLRKDFLYYSQFEWAENPENPYVWLNKENKWYSV